jgi:phage gp29-like protein
MQPRVSLNPRYDVIMNIMSAMSSLHMLPNFMESKDDREYLDETEKNTIHAQEHLQVAIDRMEDVVREQMSQREIEFVLQVLRNAHSSIDSASLHTEIENASKIMERYRREDKNV